MYMHCIIIQVLSHYNSIILLKRKINTSFIHSFIHSECHYIDKSDVDKRMGKNELKMGF